jgi:hypothetical protein
MVSTQDCKTLRLRHDLEQVPPMESEGKLHYSLQSSGRFHALYLHKRRIICLRSARVVIGDLDIKVAQQVVTTILNSGGCVTP